jgi:hypothetical protein
MPALECRHNHSTSDYRMFTDSPAPMSVSKERGWSGSGHRRHIEHAPSTFGLPSRHCLLVYAFTPTAQSRQIEAIGALLSWWSTIFSENRHPPSDQVRGQAFSGSCCKSKEAAPKGENQCRSKQPRCAIGLSVLSPQRRFRYLYRSRKLISKPMQRCLRRNTLRGCTIRSRGNRKCARGFMAPRQIHRGGVRGHIGTSSRLANRRGRPATRITTDRGPA